MIEYTADRGSYYLLQALERVIESEQPMQATPVSELMTH
jgi:hypothetical protein